jgi:hypothetical protein
MVLTYTVVDHGDRPLWFPMLDQTWATICHAEFEYRRGVACKVVRQKVSRETWTTQQIVSALVPGAIAVVDG